MNTTQGIRYIVNASPDHGKGPAFLSLAETAAVQAFHEALPEYAPTALVPLPEPAESLRIKAAFIFGDVKQALKFNSDSVLLLFSTEGDPDPEAYREIVGRTET